MKVTVKIYRCGYSSYTVALLIDGKVIRTIENLSDPGIAQYFADRLFNQFLFLQ